MDFFVLVFNWIVAIPVVAIWLIGLYTVVTKIVPAVLEHYNAEDDDDEISPLDSSYYS